MKISPLTQVTVLIVISFVLSFLSLSMLTYLFFKLKQIFNQQQEIILMDAKIRKRATKQINKIATERIDDIIKKTSLKLETELMKHFQDLAEFSATESNKMGQFIIKQQEAITRESQYHVANMLLKAEKEVADYKKSKLNVVDQQVRDIIFRAAREAIGRSISFTEHEDLVNKALERAKREKIFT